MEARLRSACSLIDASTAPILVPILDWLPHYTLSDLLSDAIAGCTVFALLIPQGMAYAILAGLPPVYGLYTASIPIFVYVLLGTSRHISMGPMAITSLLLGTTTRGASNYTDGSPDYIHLALNISMLAGIITFLLGYFKLGVLANFLGPSVMTGFITASSLLIALSQIKYITGIVVPKFTYSHQTIIYILSNLDKCNKWSLAIGITSWGLLYLVKYWKANNKPTPENKNKKLYQILNLLATMSSLIAVIVGSIVAWRITASGSYVDIVGDVPAGLLPPGFSFVDTSTVLNVLPSCFIISVIAFAGNWAVSKKFANAHGYEVNATQELIATGMTTVIGVLFNGYIVQGGLARSAVNVESGAKTQMSGFISAVLIVIALLCFTKLFHFIPMAILGAVIEVSVASMIDFSEFIIAFHMDKNDFAVIVVTFSFTFFLGISVGIFAGIVLSIAFVMRSTAYPNIVHLGRLPQEMGGFFKNIDRFKEAIQVPHIAIVRMDASLYFANCEALKEVVLKASKGIFHTSKSAAIQLVVLDVSAWTDIDLAGIKVLDELFEALMKQKIQLALACAKFEVRDKLHLTNLISKLGATCLHNSCDEAVASLRHRRMSVYVEMQAVLGDGNNNSSRQPLTIALSESDNHVGSNSHNYNSINNDQASPDSESLERGSGVSAGGGVGRSDYAEEERDSRVTNPLHSQSPEFDD